MVVSHRFLRRSGLRLRVLGLDSRGPRHPCTEERRTAPMDRVRESRALRQGTPGSACSCRAVSTNGLQYSFFRPHRSSSWRLRHYRVSTGRNGGRLTSCPCSIGSGCGSVDSAAAASSRCLPSSASTVFCRSMVGLTPTFSGGIGGPTAPQATNSPIVTPATMDVAFGIRTFTRASARVL